MSYLSLKFKQLIAWARKSWVLITVIFLLAAMAGQMAWQANYNGATTDEQIHILSGYSTLTQGHILFDPEHPPLAKVIATLPLLVIKPTVPDAALNLSAAQAGVTYDTYGEANIWAFDMVFGQGNDTDQILLATRTMMILVAILLGLAVFALAKELWGTAAGLAALTLIAFEPSFVGHGYLVNDDVAAALFVVATLYGFARFLRQPSYGWIIVTGLIFGLGLITKYSLLLMAPALVLILFAWLLTQKDVVTPLVFGRMKNTWVRYFFALFSMFIIGWGVIWLSYGAMLVANPAQNPTSVMNIRQVPDVVEPIAPYVLPVMYSKGAAFLFNPERDGRHSYLVGACYIGGRWDYFPTLWLFKTPLPIIGLFGLSLYLFFLRRKELAPKLWLLGIPIAVYLAFCMVSKINIGYRHAFPVGALIIVAAAYPYSLVKWREFWQRLKQFNRHSLAGAGYPLVLLGGLVAVVVISFNALPHQLSYYNILSGEPYNRPLISNDSNTDWSQGTKALQEYMRENNIESVALDNFNGIGEAVSRGMAVTEADPENRDYRGYLALSRSVIIEHYCFRDNDWGWVVDRYEPVAIIGGAINLYKLD